MSTQRAVMPQLGSPKPFLPREPAEAAFARFLSELGFDLADPHLADTPRRVTKMYREALLGGEEFGFTNFPADGTDQMVFVGSIPFTSFCAHHLLPFTGVAHIAYIPAERIAGISKFARTVQRFAASPQVQERLTKQIADFLDDQLAPRGIAVVMEARHACMELRGAKAVGSLTITSSLSGFFRDDPAARAEFFALVNRSRQH